MQCNAFKKPHVLIHRVILYIYEYLEYYKDWRKDLSYATVPGYVRKDTSFFAQVGILKSYVNCWVKVDHFPVGEVVTGTDSEGTAEWLW